MPHIQGSEYTTADNATLEQSELSNPPPTLEVNDYAQHDSGAADETVDYDIEEEEAVRDAVFGYEEAKRLESVSAECYRAEAQTQ
jgi:hypothetical protein